jgi:hypothetical protein
MLNLQLTSVLLCPCAAAAPELLPPRSARPKTTTAVARRLISNALGNREVSSS